MPDTEKKSPVVAEGVPTVTFTLDGREVTVPKGTTILLAAQMLGIDIPTFCWHPKLTAAGSCRMCYVEIEKWPKLAISCATEAMDGMVVHTESEKVLEGRRAVIEFTLINHPLDCPTCDKGGECTLQDLTLGHGGTDGSRYDFEKHRFGADETETTFDDKRIGPEIILNRNRCIRCYRCVRANKEAFGEYDLGAFERGDHTEIDAAPGQQVDNPFSGNLVEICPVGALTNTDWRYKVRVWLTQTTSSICPFYSSGANTLLYKNEHQGRIFRVTSRRNDDIDDGWLSDVTRYGYQVATSPDRLKRPLVKKGGKQVEASWAEALDVIKKRLIEIRDKKGRVCIGGLVSPTQDNATLFSFSKLIRKVLGSNNIDFRTDYRMLPKDAGAYDVLCSRPFRIADIDSSDLIVTLGSDLLKEHPNEYLRIRRAMNFNAATIYALNPYGTKTADVARAELIYRAGTEEILLNGFCLAAVEDGLVDNSKIGDLLSRIQPATCAEAARLCGVDPALIKEVAAALARGKKITFFAGEIVDRSKARETIAAALCNLDRLFGLHDRGQLAILPRYANSRGAAKLGLLPNPSPALKRELTELWGGWPEAEPLTTDKMMVNMKKEEVNGCLVIGCNPVMLYPDREFAHGALEGLDFLVVADLFETDTTALADVVLPLAAWTEYDGEYVNLEGRVQRANKALSVRSEARPGFEIAELIAQQLDHTLFESAAERAGDIERLLAVDETQPWPETFLEVKPTPEEPDDEYPIPIFIGDDPHHTGHLTEKANSLVNFQSEAYVEISRDLAERLGLGEGDSARVESPVGKIVAPVRVSCCIKNDAVFVPRNFVSARVNSLLMRKCRVDRVKITKVVD